jgi:hypothetical protein
MLADDWMVGDTDSGLHSLENAARNEVFREKTFESGGD